MAVSLLAQIDEGEEFEGTGERTLQESFKLSDAPEMHEPDVPILDVDYIILARQVATDFDVESIAAAKLNVVEPLDQIYNGYVRAGIGLQTTMLFDLYYNSVRSRTDGWGINLHHLSTTGNVKDRGPSNMGNTGLHLFGKKFLRNHEIGGDIDFDRNAVRFYGFDPDSIPTWTKDTVRQVFSIINASAHIKSFFKDSADWNYEFSLGYYNLQDKYDSKENNILLDGMVRKFLKNNLLLFGVQLDFNNYKYMSDPLYDFYARESFYDNTILTLNPKISSRGHKWNADAGVKIVMDADHTANFRFYPDLEFKYSLFNDVFVPYVGIVGGIERNSYRSLTSENPFVRPDITLGEDMYNTNNKFQFYGGIRGTLSSALSFNLKGSQGRYVNMPLFVNLPGVIDTVMYENQFYVEYDTVDVLSVVGEITYQRTEKLTIFLKGEYNSYTTTSQAYAWNKPEYAVSLTSVYNVWDKLYVKTNLFAVGPRKAKTFIAQPGAEALVGSNAYAIDLDGFFDMDIGLEYRYTSRLSAFANFNNILGQRYDLWYQYPVQGFNLLGGVTFKF